MATILDSFFVRLGFEVDEKGLKAAQSGIANLGKSVLSLGVFSGLSVAGMLGLATSTATALAEVDKLSQRTGIATEQIAAMTRAGVDFDVSTQAMNASLENVNLTLGGIVTGTAPRMVAIFQKLGLSAKDATGGTKDVVTFLGDVAERIKNLSTGAQQQILSRLGIDKDMIGMLRNGRAAFEDLYKAAQAKLPFRDEDYKRAAQFDAAMKQAKLSVTELGQSIGLVLVEQLQKFITKLQAWWNTNGKRITREFQQSIREWSRRINDVVGAISKLTGGTVGLTKAMKLLGFVVGIVVGYKLGKWAYDAIAPLASLAKWAFDSAINFGRAAVAADLMAGGLTAEAAAAQAAAASTWEILLPLLGIAAVVAAVVAVIAAAVYLIIDDFRAWREGADSVIGRFQKNFPAAFKFVSDAIGYLKDAFVDFWNAIKAFWAQVGPIWIFFAKKLALIAAVIIGVVIAAVVALLYITVLVVTKILTWWLKLQTFLMKVIPLDLIKELWNELVNYFAAKIDEMTAKFAQWGDAVKAIWQDVADFFKPIIDWFHEQWAALTTTSAWEAFAANLKAVWDGIMGWLDPILSRIASAVSLVSNIVSANLMQGEQLAPARPIVPAPAQKPQATATAPSAFAPAPFAFAPLSVALAGVAGSGYPASVTNAQRSSVVSHKTDVKATINVTSPNPEAAGRAVAGHVDNLASADTRNAQIGHH